MNRLSAFNLNSWIDEHRHLLKPPVGNAQVWKDAEFIVMVVGGPNRRTDFHIDPGEEFFYQLEGAVTLRIMEDGRPRDLVIGEGDVLLLPPRIPHSPRRPASTVGLVIERVRRADELDHLRWYCEKCNHLLHDSEFHCRDIETQLKPIMEAFYRNQGLRTCSQCGTISAPPVAEG